MAWGQAAAVVTPVLRPLRSGLRASAWTLSVSEG